jgi:hypothetical protein
MQLILIFIQEAGASAHKWFVTPALGGFRSKQREITNARFREMPPPPLPKAKGHCKVTLESRNIIVLWQSVGMIIQHYSGIRFCWSL